MLAGSGLSSRVIAARDQVSCDLGGEAAILQLASGIYYGLNPVGARVWALLQQPRTAREIRDALLAEYDVDRERCERDLLALLHALAAEFHVDGRTLTLGASIGISLYPTDAGDGDALLRNADAAMYRAKQLGRNNYRFYGR